MNDAKPTLPVGADGRVGGVGVVEVRVGGENPVTDAILRLDFDNRSQQSEAAALTVDAVSASGKRRRHSCYGCHIGRWKLAER